MWCLFMKEDNPRLGEGVLMMSFITLYCSSSLISKDTSSTRHRNLGGHLADFGSETETLANSRHVSTTEPSVSWTPQSSGLK